MKKKIKIGKNVEIGALLEHVDDRVTLIAEQNADLNGKVDRIEKKLNVIAEDVEVIKMDIEFIKHC
ncbi:MAG: hypothetical protein UW43_C0004G0046 [Candidatus Yanofskybacteria bacterium GW2011_GWA1_44_21]|uniref:Uncharacterized protein n=2 Tax=Candidatus Yanofskyibacteriota TaxID=1752733 RepID=A0A1F8GZH7_9BACT|nr:MAG: hypothetical protein UW14_C0005G0032 [Candidatus Yanofskybacteria bacterium GW2011_GWA2_44_10]KKT50614.1 MAG: hypothetical protein UW43_C0004G0046 [Candidatus Yanofskybacteria bacterium GW2011_GWA1_44_21]KKT90128.1 MAG: hypothetical protein UW90_C0006G0028 [Candidatus Yanofskybacteria bacterium GW2011_GWB1_45_11]OGN02793.1 MAG: hypothetical protein A2657_01460 [Candidatus Yanofskybacteria bacterium RIFCSPHIGHO2_01_FULL_44_110b]OGN14666.1 MAG: hypothetical protein A3C01_03205 [Candidatus